MEVFENKRTETDYQKLIGENESLQLKLTEAEETLFAIQNGAIDAVVVTTNEGSRVFTLEGADYSYRIFVETMDEGAATITCDHYVMYCNKRLSEILNIPAEQVIGNSIDKFIEVDDLPVFDSIITKGLQEPSRGEVKMLTSNSVKVTVLVSCSPIYLNVKGACLIFTELTELKKAQEELKKINDNLEETVNTRTKELTESNQLLTREIEERLLFENALRESEKKYRELVEKLNLAMDSGNIGTWEWNLLTNEVNWDERLEVMFGLKKGAFDRTYDSFEKFLNQEDVPRIKRTINKTIEENAPFETVYQVSLNNGESKYINSKGIIEKDKNGNPLKMIGVCFDITEMKKGAEKALFKVNEELLRSNRELAQFAYVASHDLQEPLRMVSSFTQLLAQRYKDKLDDDAQEFIKFAVEGATRMQRLINDLLAYSRIQTRGKEFTKVDMNVVLANVLKNYSFQIDELKARITNDLLPVVLADELQMEQLLQNLIGNALKFCKDIPVINVSFKDDENYFVFSVKDNGIGIESQYFERIFQLFQRLWLKAEYEGTGIGLSISKNIVERHGGKLWLESEIGSGSTFYFSISKTQKQQN